MKLIDKAIKEQPSGLEKLDKKELIFISGQISGLLFHDAINKFSLASVKLIDMGYGIVNPLTIERWKPNLKWVEYMDLCVPELMRCDAIYMLKDWGSSRGARIEYAIAKEMGLKIIYES